MRGSKGLGGTAGGTLRIRALGGLTVEGLAEHEVGSRKGRQLVKALVLARGAPVATDRLVEILWGDDPPARPAEQVGVLVSRLRGVFGAQRLPRSDAGYALLVDWFDLAELEARVADAAAALDAGRLGAARAASAAALALAHGELLPEEDAEWVEADRTAAAALATAARRIGAEAASRSGDHTAAAALAEQALAHDPSDEASLRILMHAHVAAGRDGAALSAYARVRERLAEDLGVSPMPETEALHRAILLGEGAPRPTAEAPGPAQPPSLVGRADQLRQLSDVVAAARDHGSSAIVVVSGEAGIGKSALVEAWQRSVADDVLILSGRCDELGRDLPLQPVADALAAHLRMLPAEERQQVLGDDAVALRPLLGGSHPGGDRASSGVDAEVGRARLFASLAAVVGRAAGGSPALLIVEDLHVDAGATAAWLAFAVRRMPGLVVVATSRPDPSVEAVADVVVRLGPFSLAEVEQIVGPERAPDLHARSGGLPLLVVALAPGADGETTSLAEAIERRVAGLGVAASTVRTAAVLGAAVDLDLLAAVLHRPAAELLDHLDSASLAGVLAEGDGYRFRHQLEREALERSLGSTRRALVHREAARALAARPVTEPLPIAVHARLGGDAALAIEWFVAAATESEARFDLDSAESHLNAALGLGEAAEALVVRARIRMAATRLDEAEADAVRAIAAGGGAPALEVAGWVAYYQRRYDTALARADEALARAVGASLRASCLALAGRVLHGSGHLADAASRLEAAVHLDASPEARGLAGVWLGQLRAHQGMAEDALALADRALVDPDALVHPFAPLHGRFVRVMALGHLGRPGDALAACEELEAAAQRAGLAGERFRGPAANVRAWLLRWTGRPEEADELNRLAVDLSHPNGPRAEAYYAGLLDLVDGRLLDGDADGAGVLLGQLAGIESWNGTMAWHQRHRWGLASARLALITDAPGRAAELAAGVRADAAARGAERYATIATAVAALATQRAEAPGAVDRDSLARTVEALRIHAGLEGWCLVDQLADAFGVAAWASEAQRRAAQVVAACPDPDAAQRWVARVRGR